MPYRIEIHITIILGTSDQPARDDGAVNDLDQELQEFQARHTLDHGPRCGVAANISSG